MIIKQSSKIVSFPFKENIWLFSSLNTKRDKGWLKCVESEGLKQQMKV